MGTLRNIISISLLSVVLLLSPFVDAEETKEQGHVDIDQSITIKIEFDEGESMSLDAEITASKDPVSIFLIKGEEEYQVWRETEDIDIQAIMAGENVTSGNGTFIVIENFSESNVTNFSESMSIGEKDTYYLVIVIFRETGMSKADILSRGSTVDYNVEWNEETKEVPYYLIPVAILFALLGIGLIIFYFRSNKQDEKGHEEEDPIHRGRSPLPPSGRRAPPMG